MSDDIKWAAGLFEGEGCITVSKVTRGSRFYQYPKVALTMTDEDVVLHFAEAVGVGRVTWQHSPAHAAKGWKPKFAWQVSGARAVEAMELLAPYFGKRRTARWKEVQDITRKEPK